MKKFLSAVLAAMLIISSAACSSKAPTSSTESSQETASSAAESPSSDGGELAVDKGLLDVTITIPASMLGEEDIDTVIAEAKEQGYKDVVKNDDGTVTYKMSKSEHSKMIKDMAQSIDQTLDDLVNDGVSTSIKTATASKDYTRFEITVDRTAYEQSFDGFQLLALPMVSSLYQTFNGVDESKIKCIVAVIDESNKSIISETTYPDDLDK